jgi:hypothetical protein
MPRPRRPSLRTSALFYVGALSLHELRYLVGWGAGAERALGQQGHAYLAYAMPWAVALAAAGLAQVVGRLGARRGEGPDHRRPGTGAWLVASAGLLSVYAAQETVEGLLAPGHPAGLAGVFGHGGLVAVPLALALGGLIVMTERRARIALGSPSRLGATLRRWIAPAPSRPDPPTPVRGFRTSGVLALYLAGRAPPATA